jgi:ketosteroid isomerase-like protein
MAFGLSERRFGAPRSLEALIAIQACEEVFTAFCDLMDAGEVDAAVDLHADDLVFYDAGRAEPMIGKEPLRVRLKKVRFSYPGRRTLHTPSNFRFHKVTAEEAECRVVISLFDLVRNPEGKGISAYSTELLGYATEDVRFTPDAEGVWKFQTRKVAFMAGAKRLPIGMLPKDLPWDQEA